MNVIQIGVGERKIKRQRNASQNRCQSKHCERPAFEHYQRIEAKNAANGHRFPFARWWSVGKREAEDAHDYRSTRGKQEAGGRGFDPKPPEGYADGNPSQCAKTRINGKSRAGFLRCWSVSELVRAMVGK